MAKLVYSTATKKEEPKADEAKPDTGTAITSAHPSALFLRIFISKSGRGGKTVTLIDGFTGDEKAVAALAKTVKSKLGVGGTVEPGKQEGSLAIVLQGDQREKALEMMEKNGFKAKIV